jgi:hypothetical protein
LVVRIGRLGFADRKTHTEVAIHDVGLSEAFRGAAVERFFNKAVQVVCCGN